MNITIDKLTSYCNKNLLATLAIFLAFGGILASSLWISTPYSYWLDELYSVTAANEAYSSLHSILLKDVHPPLYQLLLKGWILVFGDSEPSTRFLSWIFANAAAFYFYRSTLKHGRFFSTIAILFFLTNSLYIYYANETRSYAMTLFLTTILAFNFPASKSNPSLIFLFSCILLSLTHYFGLILAGVTLAICFLQNIKHRQSLLILFLTGLACLLWPLYHIFFGEMLNKTNGNFWIQVNGIYDSLKIAASGYLPKMGKFGGGVLFLGLLLAMTLALYNKRNIDNSLSNIVTVTFNSSLISFAFILIVALIDLWSPISTKRNYIVLVPFVGIALAGSVTLIANKYPGYSKKILGVFLVFCTLSLCKSFYDVYRKSTVWQDWRGASLYLKNNHHNKSIYYTSSTDNDTWRHLVANFYLKKFSNGSLEAKPYVVGKTILNRPAAILFGHDNKRANAIEQEMTEIGAKQSYSRNTAVDIKKGSVGVYVVE